LKDIVDADLGDKWYISDTSIKPYPACRHNHYALDLVSKIVKENKLKPEKISMIVIRGLGSYKQPPWNNYEPQNQFELQFSVPFAVAIAVHQIKPGPRWMDADLLKNEILQNFAKRIVIEVEPEIAEIVKLRLPLPTLEIPTTVKIIAEGKEYTATTRNAKGDGFSISTRMTDEEVMEKFKENASNILKEEKIEWIIEKVFALDKLGDIEELFQSPNY
jgi:2-methylcitrate dehydratase PrpD